MGLLRNSVERRGARVLSNSYRLKTRKVEVKENNVKESLNVVTHCLAHFSLACSCCPFSSKSQIY